MFACDLRADFFRFACCLRAICVLFFIFSPILKTALKPLHIRLQRGSADENLRAVCVLFAC